MATAELAVATPVVVVLLAACLAGVSAGIDQIRCVDAARAAARALGRGDSPAVATGLVRELGPPGARLAVSGMARAGGSDAAGGLPAAAPGGSDADVDAGGWAQVVVTATHPALGAGPVSLGSLTLRASAVADLEMGDAGG